MAVGFFRGGARWVDGGSPFAAVAGSVGLAPDGGGEWEPLEVAAWVAAARWRPRPLVVG